jgi:hypothetical protein
VVSTRMLILMWQQHLLGLQVTLSARDSWTPEDSERLQTQDPAKWPVMAFSFQPEQVLQSQPVSGKTPKCV